MKLRRPFLSCFCACLLAGCGSGPGTAGGGMLESLGLKKPPELPDAQKPPRTVAIRLHAADWLNVDEHGAPLALVTRIYKLRQAAAFDSAPFAAFLDPQAERAALGADLLEVREVTLVPGQHYEVTEKVTREAGYVGVVALFRAPAQQRWRLAFPAAEAEQAGLTVGLHACALSAGAGARPTHGGSALLSSVHCQ